MRKIRIEELRNDEQREAIMDEQKREIEGLIAALPEADQERYRKVDEAMKLLTDAGIYVYIFPVLKDLHTGEPSIAMIHNNADFAVWKNGHPDRATAENVFRNNLLLVYSFASHLSHLNNTREMFPMDIMLGDSFQKHLITSLEFKMTNKLPDSVLSFLDKQDAQDRAKDEKKKPKDD